jgi:drug/metabolite transporter (DMT)-like permease
MLTAIVDAAFAGTARHLPVGPVFVQAGGMIPLTYFEGVACALGAGLAWGLVFVVPLILLDYPPVLLTVGRYLAFGVIALPLAWRDWSRLARLDRQDWLRALELALVGNLLYYGMLASAIQLADAPLPTMLIGTLPIVIAVCSNFGARSVAWKRLLPPLAVIALGILLVNRQELGRLDGTRNLRDYLLGGVLGLGAVVCWTWYPIRNARWLQARPYLASGTWATAQGLATLPLALLVFAAVSPSPPVAAEFAWPLGPRPLKFVALMLLVGLTASWLGTLLWNRASKLLPTALSGQLIVFETLAALSYAFWWRGELPAAGTVLGVVLLVCGVLLGVRAFRPH